MTINLADGSAAAGQTPGVVVGGEIAHESGHAVAGGEQGERALQECRLPRAGAGHEADDPDAGGMETLAEGTGEDVVLLEDVLADLHEARRGEIMGHR